MIVCSSDASSFDHLATTSTVYCTRKQQNGKTQNVASYRWKALAIAVWIAFLLAVIANVGLLLTNQFSSKSAAFSASLAVHRHDADKFDLKPDAQTSGNVTVQGEVYCIA